MRWSSRWGWALVALAVGGFGAAGTRAAASAPAPRPPGLVPPPRVLHTAYSTLDGLPTNNLVQIVQDRDGYLWIATWDGLVRFDGVRMITYRVSDTPELGSSRIGGLLVAGDGSLWIRNRYGGLCRYDHGRFDAVASDADAVSAMVEGPDGSVLYVGAAGLWRAKGLERELVDPLAGLGRPVERAVVDRRGVLWLADREHLARGVGGEQRVFDTGQILSMAPFRDGVVFAREDASWGVASADGWHPLLDPDSDPSSGLGSGSFIRYVEPLASGTSTVSDAVDGPLLTIGGGAARIGAPGASRRVATVPGAASERPGPLTAIGPDGSSWVAVGRHLLVDGETVADLGIRSAPMSMLVDRHGAAWIATEADGLHVVRRARVSVLGEAQGLPGENVTAVFRQRSGAVWVGVRGAGVVRLDQPDLSGAGAAGDPGPGPGQSRSTRFLRPDGRTVEVANAFAEDRSGTVWAGLLGGLFRAVDGRMVRVAEPGAPARVGVVSLLSLPGGGLAVGTKVGLYLRSPSPGGDVATWRTPEELGLAGIEVRRIVRGENGVLWLATSDGVARLAQDGEVRWLREATVDRPHGHAGRPVRGLFLDGRGVLWIGVEGGGLCRLDTREWETDGRAARRIEPRSGELPDTIHQILDDRFGNLWLSSNRGILKASITDLDAVAAGSGEQLVTVRLDERDGMVDREANGTAGDSGFADDRGRLWFPTQGGVVVVDPAVIAARESPPRVVLEAVRAGDARVWPGGSREGQADQAGEGDQADQGHQDGSAGHVVLGPRQRSFLVQFTAPDAAAPTDVSFRYRLDPFDDDWVRAGTRRQAIYTSVPPGSYRFRVESRSVGGAWGGDSRVLAIHATPRLWETAWMRAAALLMLALGVGAIWRLQVVRYRRRQEQLESVVAERTATIREQARQVEELSALRTRLFSNVSHELRTPLTLAIGPLQDLAASPPGGLDEKARERIELALRSSRRMLGLADELLQVVKLEAGEIELSARPVDLGELAQAVAERFRPLIEREGLALRVEVEPPDLIDSIDQTWADPEMVERILDNLLSNAVKFTEEGTITVRVGSAAEWAWFSVADTGRGMEPSELETLFERYRQGGAAQGRWGGFGIGLSMVEELVELHGGRVRAESAPGAGTEVRVELRRGRGHLDPKHLADPERPEVDQRLGSGTADGSTDGVSPGRAATENQAGSPTGRPAGNPAESPAGTQPEAWVPGASGGPAPAADAVERPGVLVVEDDPEMRSYLLDCLADLYEVRAARNGRQGLAAIRDMLPDVVVSDVSMPEMDGLELVQAVRADSETSFVPIILLTSRVEIADRLAGFEHGAEDYLGKPFDARELRARVNALLESRRRLELHLEATSDEGGEGEAPRWELPTPAEASAETRAFSRRLQGVIVERLGDPELTVEELAAAMHCDRSQLFRRVKQSLETTPSELLRSLRLTHAHELLRRRAGNVSEVAYAVGFRNVSHFSQAFRKRYETTPSSVREAG